MISADPPTTLAYDKRFPPTNPPHSDPNSASRMTPMTDLLCVTPTEKFYCFAVMGLQNGCAVGDTSSLSAGVIAQIGHSRYFSYVSIFTLLLFVMSAYILECRQFFPTCSHLHNDLHSIDVFIMVKRDLICIAFVRSNIMVSLCDANSIFKCNNKGICAHVSSHMLSE